jgi:hypothetical protein
MKFALGNWASAVASVFLHRNIDNNVCLCQGYLQVAGVD